MTKPSKDPHRRLVSCQLLLTLLASLLNPSVVFAASLGYSAQSGSTSADSVNCSSAPNAQWVAPTRIAANEAAYARVTHNSFDTNTVTHRLDATNFGVDLPAGSVVTGVQFQIDKHAPAGTAIDYLVRMHKADNVVGDNKAVTDSNWSSVDTDTYTTYVGATDLWGDDSHRS